MGVERERERERERESCRTSCVVGVSLLGLRIWDLGKGQRGKGRLGSGDCRVWSVGTQG